MFRPDLESTDSLVVFDDDLLRKFTLDFNTKCKFGKLDAFKYTLSNSTFAPTTTFRKNCAFGNNAPAGSFNVTMLKNAPVLMSKPFFMDADPSYRASIDGAALWIPPAFSYMGPHRDFFLKNKLDARGTSPPITGPSAYHQVSFRNSVASYRHLFYADVRNSNIDVHIDRACAPKSKQT